jgi:hypothetical protein
MGIASEVASEVASAVALSSAGAVTVAAGGLVVAGAWTGIQAVSTPTRPAIKSNWRIGCMFIKIPLHISKFDLWVKLPKGRRYESTKCFTNNLPCLICANCTWAFFVDTDARLLQIGLALLLTHSSHALASEDK